MTQLAIGKPTPLGAHYDGQGVNFTLFSAHAERVELCVFDANGQEHRYDLPGHSGDIWHGYLPDARPGLRYGYRVHGPWQPAEGHRFNPAKLLIDPCARQIDGEFKDNPLLHAGHNEPDYRDNAAIAPKCVVVIDHYDWEDDAPPRTPWGSTIIYEAHVKGLTYLHPEIPVEIRGTYKALGHPVMINYLKQLGITALELLPVAQFASEPRLQRMGLSNYWGYNPVAMFALHPAYACSPETALDEFRDAIKALHKAGIEVILDIVLNHSAELDLDGPLFSLRGIDNRSYYWIREDGDYHNWTGCGNTLNLSHPAVVDYASACLRYWVETCHVDGFRFDLAAVMGRTPEFRQDAPLFTAIQNCPVLSQVKLIAEPWDIAPGGYQVEFRRCLPSGTIISAMQPVVSGCIMICLWGRLPGVLLPPAMFLNVMIVCRVPRLISSPRMTVLRFATAFASTINTMKQTEKKIATGPTTITVTIMVKKG